MIGWMLVWSILNGGVVESHFVFEDHEACIKAGKNFGNLRAHFVNEDGELEKHVIKSTPFRCLPVNAKDQTLISTLDPEELRKEEEAVFKAFMETKASYEILDAMTTRITKSWKRPYSYQGGLEVYLRMTLEPNGELKNVRIVRASGNDAFDRSALSAVKDASPFNEIVGVDDEIFKEKYQSLTVKFRPED